MGIKRSDIEININKFNIKCEPTERYSSFDYCYNYFQTTKPKDLTKDIEKSCLTLGFYLASWGMMRASSFLIGKSVKHFQTTIEYISKLDQSVWKIDVNNYNEQNIKIILELYNDIKGKMITDKNADLILITKIMLGVFGSVPAFDTNFTNNFRKLFSHQNVGFRRINAKSLDCIHRFYSENKEAIDKLSNKTFTYDFLSGKKTKIKYTKAKIIDMYGFIGGQKTKLKT